MRRTFALLTLLAALLAFVIDAPRAATVENLYQAQAIVTGQTEKNRPAGFAHCLTDVLVKVSGDPSLLDDPRVAKLAEQAGGFVSGFRYHDRMEGIPVHDEQGTRDRPYDLTCDFDPGRIDAALRELGRTPWPAERPLVVVLLAVRNGPSAYMLTDDGTRGPGQRESFLGASKKIGVPIVLPTEAALGKAGLGVETVHAADPAAVDAAAKSLGGDLALAGSMEFSDAVHGWLVEWRLASQGKLHRWQVRGVNFDEAFRVALRGAALILSGNGAPDQK